MKWIKASERLPDNHKNIICRSASSNRFFACIINGMFHSNGTNYHPMFIEWLDESPLPESKEPQGEDKAILDDARVEGFIIGWFNEWCKDTKRSGGVLITTSIKELLKDFYNEISGQSTPQEGQEELWNEVIELYEERNYMAIELLKQSFTITRKG